MPIEITQIVTYCLFYIRLCAMHPAWLGFIAKVIHLLEPWSIGRFQFLLKAYPICLLGRCLMQYPHPKLYHFRICLNRLFLGRHRPEFLTSSSNCHTLSGEKKIKMVFRSVITNTK